MTDYGSPVEILGTTWCPDTARTRRCLRRLRVPHRLVDLDERFDAVADADAATGGTRRTPVVRIGDQVLVEPSNTALIAALRRSGHLPLSNLRAASHGQNVGDLERWLRVGVALGAIALTRGWPAPLRVPIRATAAGLAWTALNGWCPVYDARRLTSVGGPGDHPGEAERDGWYVSLDGLAVPQESQS